MYVIAVTGKMGSGKSTAARLFASLGAVMFSADTYVQTLMQPGTDVYQLICDHFPSVRLKDQSIDRALLADCVFSNDDERRWLEGLVHPLVREAITAWAQENNALYGVVEVPLLTRENCLPCMKRICVVDAPESLCKQRVKKRDDREDALISAMLTQQASRDALLAMADDVMFNKGSLDALVNQVERLHVLYAEAARNDYKE